MAKPLVPTAGRRFAFDDHGAAKRAATRSVRQEQRVGVGSRGVYYVPCDPISDPTLYVLEPKTGRNVSLGRLDGLFNRPLGLSVSPDGKTIMYVRQVLSRADLMLIDDNFR